MSKEEIEALLKEVDSKICFLEQAYKNKIEELEARILYQQEVIKAQNYMLKNPTEHLKSYKRNSN